MNGKSPNIAEEKLARLKELLPEAFSEGKVDNDQLKTNTALLMEDAGIEFRTI